MRDDLMGGLLATAVTAPVLAICCGSGGVLLVGFLGAIGTWASGLGGIGVLLATAAGALVWRDLHRNRRSGGCGAPKRKMADARNG